MIPVVNLPPEKHWDQTMWLDLLTNKLHPTGLEFKHHGSEWWGHEGAVIVLPGRHWLGDEEQGLFGEIISHYKWVLCIKTGDEEDAFNTHMFPHPNLVWWIQTPRPDRVYPNHSRYIGVGYTPHFSDLSRKAPDKNLLAFLAAQNTHTRRHEAFDALDELPPHKFQKVLSFPTPGFTQGLDIPSYSYYMGAARVVPCPSGVFTPDSFRLYEALQVHAVPIADDLSPRYNSRGYWKLVFPDAPFPVITDWENLPDVLEKADDIDMANRTVEWWIGQKQKYVQWLKEDLSSLGAI